MAQRRSPRRAGSIAQTSASTHTLGSVMITGGGGFLGRRLALMIAARSLASRIVLFDVRPPKDYSLPPNATFMKGDLRDPQSCMEATKGIDTVFHIASYGMSGLEMQYVAMIYAVNVEGTEHLLEACRMQGVQRLVYTSTYNTVFSSKPLYGVHPSAAVYVPDEEHVDHYSRSKGRAERLVLSANASARSDQKKPTSRRLATCALRAAGIYGDGEERHFPRIIRYMQLGLACFTVGSSASLVEWVYVDNLAHAHILAAMRLTSPSAPIAAKAYFISDQSPINNFEFFRPLYEALGYSYPRLSIPVSVALLMAMLMEWVHRLLRPLVLVQPLLSRAEVYKCSLSHYFDCKPVQEELGYFPIVSPSQAMSRTVAYYQSLYHSPTPSRHGTSRFLTWSALAFYTVILLGLSLYVSRAIGTSPAKSP